MVPLDEHMTDQELLDKSKKDVLSSSYLNFYDSEDQIYEKVSLDNSSDAKTSLYKFSGRFRLDRDLRRFPFDNSKLRIELTSLLPATNIHFFLDTSGSMVLRTVENSYHLFRQRLQDELGILADPAPDARLIERISGGEDWIGPHAVERPDEECVAEVPPGGGTGGAVTGQ